MGEAEEKWADILSLRRAWGLKRSLDKGPNKHEPRYSSAHLPFYIHAWNWAFLSPQKLNSHFFTVLVAVLFTCLSRDASFNHLVF